MRWFYLSFKALQRFSQSRTHRTLVVLIWLWMTQHLFVNPELLAPAPRGSKSPKASNFRIRQSVQRRPKSANLSDRSPSR